MPLAGWELGAYAPFLFHIATFNCKCIRLGLTQNLEPARELRTFHRTGTMSDP